MTPFTTHTGHVSYLPMKNVDTDMIIPKQFLKTLTRSGLGKALFYELRYDEQDQKKPDFILHQNPKTSILIADENFGCGSSREHAVWALMDFGIRCVIAPSFADIFYNNCFKNGVLPIALAPEKLLPLTQEQTLSIHLQEQTITDSKNHSVPFEIDIDRKEILLKGLDDIALTLQHSEKIDNFEQKQRLEKPWLWKRTS